jgi:sporulation protein YabP
VEEKRTVIRKRHQLSLRGREALTVDGVVNVESFDEKEIVLETDEGDLTIRGDDLHIKELNLDTGSLSVEGFVHSLEYADNRAAKKTGGFFSRVFK